MNKVNWITFRINDGAVVTKTENSMLLRMPSSSRFRDYRFWLFRKLVRVGNLVVFHPSFRIKIFKKEKRFGEWVVTDEREIDAGHFATARYDGDDVVRYKEIVPKRIEPMKDVKPEGSLLRQGVEK